MSTKILFKIQAIIFLINGLAQLFVTKRYFELASIEVNPGGYFNILFNPDLENSRLRR